MPGEPDAGATRIEFWVEGERRVEERPIILVVEVDETIQELVRDALTEGGYQPAMVQIPVDAAGSVGGVSEANRHDQTIHPRVTCSSEILAAQPKWLHRLD